jgi:hypothetical protein
MKLRQLNVAVLRAGAALLVEHLGRVSQPPRAS